MTHLKVTCESHLHINFHEITCVRELQVPCSWHTSKSKHESFGLKVA